jgi:predicted HD superfamily hydrolase involved in NAD metabolism
MPHDDRYTAEQAAELGRVRAAVEGRLSGKRLAHTLGVARTARELAGRWGADPWQAEVAGLLHDWDKQLPHEELWLKAERYGIVAAGERDERVRPVLHGLTAAASLPSEFPELPPEVFSAVQKHTVGDVRMSVLDMVVYVADLVEPGRDFGGADELRERVFAAAPELGFALAMQNVLAHLVAQGAYISPQTVAVWNAHSAPLTTVK